MRGPDKKQSQQLYREMKRDGGEGLAIMIRVKANKMAISDGHKSKLFTLITRSLPLDIK